MAAEHHHVAREYIDLKQLRQLLPLSPRTLRHYVHDPVDPLPAYQIHGKLIFRCSEVVDWIAKHRVEPLDSESIATDLLANSSPSFPRRLRTSSKRSSS